MTDVQAEYRKLLTIVRRIARQAGGPVPNHVLLASILVLCNVALDDGVVDTEAALALSPPAA